MAAKKQPSNLDLSTKLDIAIGETKRMRQRIDYLEQWKLQEDAYKAALKQVHKEQDSGSDKILNKELIKALGLAITAIISLVALVQASK